MRTRAVAFTPDSGYFSLRVVVSIEPKNLYTDSIPSIKRLFEKRDEQYQDGTEQKYKDNISKK